jgi:YVTN family beta-propeller protein
MAILPVGNKIYVAYNGRGASADSVVAINVATNKIIATIPGAGSLFIDPAGASIYGIFGAHLSIIDTATDTIKATVTIPSSEPGLPDGTALDVAFDPSGAWVYVGASDYCSCFDGVNGRIVVIEASKYSIVSTISLPIIPKALAITPSGSQIYAGGDVPTYCSRPSCVRPGGVAVIDTATRSVFTTISPISDAPFQTSPGTVQVNPNGTSVYSSDGSSVYVIDTKANAIVATLPPSAGFIFKPDANPPVPGTLRQYTVQSGNSTVTSMQWGAPGDIPVPADYDGDGKTDIAVFRPREGKEEAIWYIIRSSDGVYIRQQWGSVALGDVPVPVDYDGDGRADIAIWRPFEGAWYIRRSSDGQTTSVRFARNTDLPTPADFDGDGVTDLAAYSGGIWMIFGSTIGLTSPEFGTALDIPVPADFDGDGRIDLAVWNPGTGIWSVLNSSNLSVTTKQWGAPGDIPVPRDFDGDHKADFAIWRPSNGNWFVINSGNRSMTSLVWGASGDLPVPGDYDGDKRADPSVYRPEIRLKQHSPPRRGGVDARSIKCCEATFFRAQTGWSVWHKPSIFAGLTTPSAPLKEASRHFVYVASSPPLRGGEFGLTRRDKTAGMAYLIALLREQPKAYGLRAFIFNFEIARHGSCADVKGMRLAGTPIGEHLELRSGIIKLRLVSHNDSGAGGGRDTCKFPHGSEVGVKMRDVVLEVELGTS